MKELKGFTKVFLQAGESTTAEILMPRKYATSFYHEGRDAWASEAGMYDVLVGPSSAELPLKGDFEVEKTTYWKGL